MDSVPFSELTSLLYERPDLKLAQVSIKASEADVRLQRSLAFPEVSVKVRMIRPVTLSMIIGRSD